MPPSSLTLSRPCVRSITALVIVSRVVYGSSGSRPKGGPLLLAVEPLPIGPTKREPTHGGHSKAAGPAPLNQRGVLACARLAAVETAPPYRGGMRGPKRVCVRSVRACKDRVRPVVSGGRDRAYGRHLLESLGHSAVAPQLGARGSAAETSSSHDRNIFWPPPGPL